MRLRLGLWIPDDWKEVGMRWILNRGDAAGDTTTQNLIVMERP